MKTVSKNFVVGQFVDTKRCMGHGFIKDAVSTAEDWRMITFRDLERIRKETILVATVKVRMGHFPNISHRHHFFNNFDRRRHKDFTVNDENIDLLPCFVL
jgi:hypothetical protein